MGSLFRKTATKALPAGAEIFTRKGERFARWLDAKGKARTAPLTKAGNRIVVTAATFTAKYRDGERHVIEVATGCRDETAARSVLTTLERRAELVKSGVMTSGEGAVSDHQATPLADHIKEYLDHQKAKGASRRVDDVRRQLQRVADDCGFVRLTDLTASKLERWLIDRAAADMGAATRNDYRIAWVSFANWCIRTRRLVTNPFALVARADAKADCRRKRRSLTEAELVKLLDVARRRPLLDAMTVRRGKRKGEAVARCQAPQRRAGETGIARPRKCADLQDAGAHRASTW
ncbi:MAG TPA: hypothetical protein VND64_07175 [Pirellulales bacterium]|nr:hypothetical protein [Pirellulales bacterium]